MCENQIKIESPDGKFEIKVGRVKEGSLNLIVNFNTIIYMNFALLLAFNPYVKKIVSIQNHDDFLGGISLEVTEDFDYQLFKESLINEMEVALR
ncbi:MAG TPA: hypothetical protein VIK55_11090 [Paludibacter sp.]